MPRTKAPPPPPSNPSSPTQLELPAVLGSLSDPVRLEIVRQLAACDDGSGELTCGQLDLPVGKSTCSHHIKTLAGAGVIAEREAGTRKYLRLRREELDERLPGLLELVLAS